MKKINLYLLLFLLFSSCEKVIEIDLNEAKPRIVIDGKIDFMEVDSMGTASIFLHWTSSFYELNTFKTIDNAQVKITDQNGHTHNLDFTSNGYYMTNSIEKGNIGDEYQLEIIYNGKTIHSTSSLVRSVKIDSLTYTVDNFGPHQANGYTVSCHFTDPAGEVNYYYLKIMIDGEYNHGYYITRDDAVDGQTISYPFFRNLIVDSSNVQVELYNIDEVAFEYFKVLTMQDQGGMSTAPGNPLSNIEGDAIGLFRVSYKDVQNIAVP